MGFIEGIFLGIIQGLSEFLPVSSTAHLTIVGKLLGLVDANHPEQWTAFIAVIQLGTLLAVLLYFFQDILEISTSFLKENIVSRTRFGEQSLQARLGWMVIFGSIPIAVIGLAFKKVIEGHLTKSLTVISFSLIVLALFMGLAELTGRFRKNLEKVTFLDSVLIGCAQAMAVIPGSSRSGTTITAGIFLGMTRESAARFSFLLSIPAVFASGLLEFKESLKFMGSNDLLVLLAGTVAAAVSGYVAIAFLLRFLRNHSTYVFVFYRIILGTLLLLSTKLFDFF
jgi:undecaprenyl-diphosphatase